MINPNRTVSTQFITGIFQAIVSAFQQVGIQPRRGLAEAMQTTASHYVTRLRTV